MTTRPPRSRALSGGAIGFAAVLTVLCVVPVAVAGAVDGPAPTRASWCVAQGSTVGGWLGISPEMPICGPGPDYGGTWSYVDLPGPSGLLGAYYNATPGFQCVELAERFLAVNDGLAPVRAEGSTVALAYHEAYAGTALYVNGSAGAVRHPPISGDVVSFSQVANFEDPSDGHVAVVISSAVDSSGNGEVVVAQENVSPSDYHKVLYLESWRLVDPASPSDAEFQYPYAAWLQPHPVLRLAPTRATDEATAAPGAVPEPVEVNDALMVVSRRSALPVHLGQLESEVFAARPTQLAATSSARAVTIDHFDLARPRADLPSGDALSGTGSSPWPAGFASALAGLAAVVALRRRAVRARRLPREKSRLDA